jgi:hypothetical protein
MNRDVGWQRIIIAVFIGSAVDPYWHKKLTRVLWLLAILETQEVGAIRGLDEKRRC